MGQSLGRKRKSRKNSPTAEQQSTASSSTAPTTTTAAVAATTSTVDANTSTTTTAVEQPSSSTTTTTVVAEQQPSTTTTTTTAEAPSSQVVDVAPTTTTTSSEEKVVEEQKTVAVEAVVTTPVAVEEEVVQVAPVEHQEQVVDEPTPTAQAPVEQEAPQEEEEKIVEQPPVEQETVATVVESTPTTTTQEEEEMKPTTEAPQQQEEAPQQEQAEEEQTEFNGSLTFSVPSHLHKYIVGPKGATIKGIQQSSGDEKLRIDLNSEENQVTITSNDNKAILSAKHQIEEVIAPHKDKLNVDAMKESKDYKVPSALHKYILGDKGSTLKSIQSEAQCNLTLNENDSITIKSTSQELIEKAFQLVVATLEKFWWYYDASTEIFTENTLTDRLFKQYRTKVSEQHELMTECYEKSKQAFDEGRKDEAKELSEQGKKHKELKEQYSKEAALAIFEEMNKDKGEDSIDLHGLLVSEALEFVEQRIQKLTESKSINILNVITGAGNHSEAEAKIKPMIAKMLDEKSLKYEKGNEGVFIVTLF